MELLTERIRGSLMDFFCGGNCGFCPITQNTCRKATYSNPLLRMKEEEFITEVVLKFDPCNINDLKPEIVETLISLFPKTKLE